MPEFFERLVEREDGSRGLQYINIHAISYIELDVDVSGKTTDETRVFLNNGYWFTVSGTKAVEVLKLIQGRGKAHHEEGTGDA